GLEPGDEILVPAYTFPATGNVVALAGLRPMLVDVDPETMNVDPARIEVGPRTKAVLAVHLFGRPARLEELPTGLPVLEDAAGAPAPRGRGRRARLAGLRDPGRRSRPDPGRAARPGHRGADRHLCPAPARRLS